MTHQQSKDVLQSPASYAAMKELHDGRLGITVTAQNSNHRWAAILAMVFGPVAVVVGASLLKNPTMWGEMPMTNAGAKMAILGILITVVGPAILMMRIVTGPPANAEFEVAAGELNADRKVTGDRLRSTYSADQVGCLYVEGNLLYVETSMGPAVLIPYGKPAINAAVGFLLAEQLWSPDPVVTVKPRRAFMSQSPQRLVFLPQSRIDDQNKA